MQTRLVNHIFAALLTTAVALCLGANGSLAQQSEGGKIGQQKLEAYAAAVEEVREVRKTYLPRLQEAQNPDERASIREEATGTMVEKINETGISVEDYNRITKRMRNDPQLAERVNEIIGNTPR